MLPPLDGKEKQFLQPVPSPAAGTVHRTVPYTWIRIPFVKKETDNPDGLSVSLAPQKEFESPTFRLGGGRSILLSYWGIYF